MKVQQTMTPEEEAAWVEAPGSYGFATMTPPVPKPCPVCSTAFYGANKFCSGMCYRAACSQRKRSAPCLQCGKLTHNSAFCSHLCHGRWTKGLPKAKWSELRRWAQSEEKPITERT